MAKNDDNEGEGAVEQDVPETKTYFLKEGKEHTQLVRGAHETLNRAGQKADLTDAQYQAFKDKFHTADEWKGHEAQTLALVEANAQREAAAGEPTPAEAAAKLAEAGGDGKATNPPSSTPPADSTGKPADAPKK